jgi:hypothetical protein
VKTKGGRKMSGMKIEEAYEITAIDYNQYSNSDKERDYSTRRITDDLVLKIVEVNERCYDVYMEHGLKERILDPCNVYYLKIKE